MNNVAAEVVRCRIRLGMHRVVMILGVGWITRDESQLEPILAPLKGCGPSGVGFLLGLAAKNGEDAMRVDGYQAHRPLALERSETLHDATAGQAKPRTA